MHNRVAHLGGALRLSLSLLLVLAAMAVLAPAARASAVYVLPVQVCDDDGNNCANSGQELYLNETNKIWEQAGISIVFLDWTSINNTAYQNFTSIPDENAFFNDTANNGISTVATVITMWFVKSITNDDWGTVDTISGRKVMIADNVFAATRLDTLAHELGHNLGLKHDDPGMDNTYLMRSGGSRTIPGAIGDITPDGAKLDKLTAAQKLTAQSSAYAVPLPAAVYLFGSALLLLRRRAAPVGA